MWYQSVSLRQDFKVDDIVTVHYFEYMKDFYFPGETHDFWEFLCVDKGEVEVAAADKSYKLKKGEIIFHEPNEFHNVKANGIVAPNLVVISFKSPSKLMSFFCNKILEIGEIERKLLGAIIAETRNAFSNRLDDPYSTTMTVSKDYCIGAEQLIKIYLEEMLIQLYRKYHDSNKIVSSLSRSIKEKSDDDIYNDILLYLENNIHLQLSIEQICEENMIGRSQLHKLFHKHNNCGVIDYFSRMKINTAKQMIREKNMNFTQIADTLGYNSIHYFSRQFKKITGMTPSEYSSSIKLLVENPKQQ